MMMKVLTMSKIKNINFLTSCASKAQWPMDEIPEVCFLGRSNVGKSTFINTITNFRNIARVSSTPGKTRLLNLFEVNNNDLRFVDVPGYGYAKVSHTMKEQFAAMIDEYLLRRKNLSLAVLLIDYRHKPSQSDIDMYNYLKHYNIPTMIVATKTDKIKKNDLVKNKKLIIKTLNLMNNQFFPFSKFNTDHSDIVKNILRVCENDEPLL